MRQLFIAILILSITFSCAEKTSSDSRAAIDDRVEILIKNMTLEEKIGQTALRGTSSRGSGLTEEIKMQVRRGEIGAMLNVKNPAHIEELQKIAVDESPNGIPLIFARDVVHGFKTIFPIPLGQAATWNMELVESGARIAAKEATAQGIRWTFAPMLDIARDPRWGRIAESPGEDPYLASLISIASVKGFQGEDLSNPSSMVACAKHFAGYGAAIGGRDYNTAIINDALLYNTYLPPFKAALDAGAGTFMTGFNELNGIPASGNEFLLKEILRDQWGFEGFVVSDWNSVIEMIPHGYAENEKEAALKAGIAGMDMEMTSTTYSDHLRSLIEEGSISESTLDEMVRNILRIKFQMGLFENPDFETKDINYAPDHLNSAKNAALESMVLLKNENNTLPLNFSKTKIALIGPLADAPHEQLGTWTFDGEKDHTVTPLTSMKEELNERVVFAKGLTHSRDKSKAGFRLAIDAAKKSDVIVFIGGEEAILSGEAHSRANIDLPGAQEDLIKELSKLNKPLILVIMAGRPITLGSIMSDVDALIMAWHPGTMGGPALADLLSGRASPSGRLPVTWPRSVGQIPIFYNHKNTGRPASKDSFVGIDDIPVGAWQSSLGNESHYLDDGFTPLFPFGFGLTYSRFEYSDLAINKKSFSKGEALEITYTLANTGEVEATEVVQYYYQDISASITRPVRELTGFDKINLGPGEEKKVTFLLPVEELGFYTKNGERILETGNFNFWVAPNAQEGMKISFDVR